MNNDIETCFQMLLQTPEMINIEMWQIPTRNTECSVYLGELWYFVHQL